MGKLVKRMNINWKIRLKNKVFWITMIPAIALLISNLGFLFGFEIDYDTINGKILGIVDAAFIILSMLGVVNDPTTHGLDDSTNALYYDKPKQ